MSIVWSIVPTDVLYEGAYPHVLPKLQEMHIGGVTMLVTPAHHGMARIERLISPNPRDYLRADWQPGSLVAWQEPVGRD